MDTDTIKLLKKNIICIEEKREGQGREEREGEEREKREGLSYPFDINKIVHKYSNTGVPLYRFFFNNEVITRNNHYLVTYKCINCESIHKVALNNILRKINRNITKCKICKEFDEIKRLNHSKYMLECCGKPKENIDIKKVITLKDKLISDQKAFDEYDDDFKNNYFRRNMSYDEFDYFRKKIISILNDKFKMDDDLIYYPIVSISNQTRFSPYLYSISRNCLEKIHHIKIKCDNCNSHFISKDLHSHKNRIKAFCKDCNLTNNIFKLRTYHNIANEKIIYQSKFELKFIRLCNDKKIYIINGPKVEYYFNNKKCTYKIDFAIPKLNYLIEIKDNHIWHREQINNGKWGEKIKGVENYIKNNEIYTKFLVIFPKNYVSETNNLVDKYWNNN